ncbi:MAG: restriction endonuclease subunit S [Deltaproteobacteria bacterium]|jgi:type I restriction enzyme S subunit|nr:restriction endonuclease subunit S [Deltaproteobacteria bacterium]
MGAWARHRLGDLATIVGGGTPPATDPAFFGGPVPWLTPKDLAGFRGKYVSRGARSLTLEGLRAANARILPKGSVLFTSRAPIGYLAMAANGIATSQGFRSLVPNRGVTAEFLYYLILHKRGLIESIASGSTFREVSASVLGNVEVRIPTSVGEQEAIAGVLGSLDDQMGLLREQMASLEDLGRGAFNLRFMARGAMRSVGLGSLLDLAYGRPLPAASRTGRGYLVMGSSGPIGRHSEFLVRGPGIVVGRKGNVGTVNYCFDSFHPIDTTFYVVPRHPGSPMYFEYLLLKSLDFEDTDSAIPGLNREAALGQRVVFPGWAQIADFNRLMGPVFAKIRHNLARIETMGQMLGLVLPRLMEGRLALRAR